MAQYDVIVIGSGPGGYVAAIRCAQLGLKTACVEGRETLGGTCLNVGCIPSKALLHASHQLHEAEENFAKMGLKGKAPSVDWKQMLAYKDDVIGQNTKGIEFLFKKNKIDWIKGWASIPEAGKVTVGDETYETKNIIVASGSAAASVPGAEVEIDEKVVVTGRRGVSKIRSNRRSEESSAICAANARGAVSRSAQSSASRARSAESAVCMAVRRASGVRRGTVVSAKKSTPRRSCPATRSRCSAVNCAGQLCTAAAAVTSRRRAQPAGPQALWSATRMRLPRRSRITGPGSSKYSTPGAGRSTSAAWRAKTAS